MHLHTAAGELLQLSKVNYLSLWLNSDSITYGSTVTHQSLTSAQSA